MCELQLINLTHEIDYLDKFEGDCFYDPVYLYLKIYDWGSFDMTQATTERHENTVIIRNSNT